MNTNGLAKRYGTLTPEERFRLIMSASSRGDEAECNRIASAGRRITLSMFDHAPYAHAFQDLAFLVFIELLDAAAECSEAWLRADEDFDLFDNDDKPSAKLTKQKEKKSRRCRLEDMAQAAGYILQTKAEGWKLFCSRMNIPPFLLWQEVPGLPGFIRLQRALKQTEENGFTPAEFLAWLNSVRPKEEPELTAIPLTSERLATSLADAYRDHSNRCSGREN